MPSREIALTKGKVTIVDESDYDWLNQWKWYYMTAGYAARTQNRKLIYMHRLILGTPQGLITDHIDMDGLNNRRQNLRVCNKSQNGFNRNPRNEPNKSSKYKGVTWSKLINKWYARIYDSRGICRNLGSFTTETEAALAYNEAALKYHGEFARLNCITQ